MRMKHGKVVFGYKDTFSLEHTLRPVIGSALVKFKSVVEGNENAGVVSTFIEGCVDAGLVSYEDENHYLSDAAYKVVEGLWMDTLDKMIFAFTEEEPNISDYNFTYVNGEDHGKVAGEGLLVWNMVCTNDEESSRYTKDCSEHEVLVQEGYELFGKYLKALWW